MAQAALLLRSGGYLLLRQGGHLLLHLPATGGGGGRRHIHLEQPQIAMRASGVFGFISGTALLRVSNPTEDAITWDDDD